MIVSKTEASARFRRSDKSEISLEAGEYGVAIVVTETDETEAYFSLSPSDTELLHKFLGEVLPMWDKDEI